MSEDDITFKDSLGDVRDAVGRFSFASLLGRDNGTEDGSIQPAKAASVSLVRVFVSTQVVAVAGLQNGEVEWFEEKAVPQGDFKVAMQTAVGLIEESSWSTKARRKCQVDVLVDSATAVLKVIEMAQMTFAECRAEIRLKKGNYSSRSGDGVIVDAVDLGVDAQNKRRVLVVGLDGSIVTFAHEVFAEYQHVSVQSAAANAFLAAIELYGLKSGSHVVMVQLTENFAALVTDGMLDTMLGGFKENNGQAISLALHKLETTRSVKIQSFVLLNERREGTEIYQLEQIEYQLAALPPMIANLHSLAEGHVYIFTALYAEGVNTKGNIRHDLNAEMPSYVDRNEELDEQQDLKYVIAASMVVGLCSLFWLLFATFGIGFDFYKMYKHPGRVIKPVMVTNAEEDAQKWDDLKNDIKTGYSFMNGRPNLSSQFKILNETFGPDNNLYVRLLNVSAPATAEEVRIDIALEGVEAVRSDAAAYLGGLAEKAGAALLGQGDFTKLLPVELGNIRADRESKPDAAGQQMEFFTLKISGEKK